MAILGICVLSGFGGICVRSGVGVGGICVLAGFVAIVGICVLVGFGGICVPSGDKICDLSIDGENKIEQGELRMANVLAW